MMVLVVIWTKCLEIKFNLRREPILYFWFVPNTEKYKSNMFNTKSIKFKMTKLSKNIVLFFRNSCPWEIIKLKDLKNLWVQLLVIGDKKNLKKFDNKKDKSQIPIVGNWSSEKLTSWPDFGILQEFLMKPCLSHPCG